MEWLLGAGVLLAIALSSYSIWLTVRAERIRSHQLAMMQAAELARVQTRVAAMQLHSNNDARSVGSVGVLSEADKQELRAAGELLTFPIGDHDVGWD